jgi:hypothetical protein
LADVCDRRVGGRDPDAGPDLHVPLADRVCGVKSPDDPLGHRKGGRGGAIFLHQDSELVAPEAGDGVAGTDALAQTVSDLDQQVVTRGVAETVVDLFEAVRVEEQDGDRRAVRCPPGEGMLDPVLEQSPVGQACEGIVEGLMEQLVFEFSMDAYVPGVEHEPLDTGLVDQIGDGGLDQTAMVRVANLEGRSWRQGGLSQATGATTNRQPGPPTPTLQWGTSPRVG